MTDKINTYIQFYLDDIELNISVKEDLTGYLENEPLHQCGFIQITDGKLEDRPIFWDNVSYFIDCRKKEFKEECKKELQEKGYDWKQTYKQIKTLLKRAKKLNII